HARGLHFVRRGANLARAPGTLPVWFRAVHPIIFSIGPLPVYSFGVMLAIAFLVSGNVVQRELGRKGLDPELASTFVVWAAVGGLVGSPGLSFVGDWSGLIPDPPRF